MLRLNAMMRPRARFDRSMRLLRNGDDDDDDANDDGDDRDDCDGGDCDLTLNLDSIARVNEYDSNGSCDLNDDDDVTG